MVYLDVRLSLRSSRRPTCLLASTFPPHLYNAVRLTYIYVRPTWPFAVANGPSEYQLRFTRAESAVSRFVYSLYAMNKYAVAFFTFHRCLVAQIEECVWWSISWLRKLIVHSSTRHLAMSFQVESITALYSEWVAVIAVKWKRRQWRPWGATKRPPSVHHITEVLFTQ